MGGGRGGGTGEESEQTDLAINVEKWEGVGGGGWWRGVNKLAMGRGGGKQGGLGGEESEQTEVTIHVEGGGGGGEGERKWTD